MVSVPASVWSFEGLVRGGEVQHLLTPGGVVEHIKALQDQDRAAFAFRRVLPEEQDAGVALREERGGDRGDGGAGPSGVAPAEAFQSRVETHVGFERLGVVWLVWLARGLLDGLVERAADDAEVVLRVLERESREERRQEVVALEEELRQQHGAGPPALNRAVAILVRTLVRTRNLFFLFGLFEFRKFRVNTVFVGVHKQIKKRVQLQHQHADVAPRQILLLRQGLSAEDSAVGDGAGDAAQTITL